MVADGLKKRFLLLPPKDGSVKMHVWSRAFWIGPGFPVTPEGSVGPHDGDQAAEGKLLADLGKQSLNIATMHILKKELHHVTSVQRPTRTALQPKGQTD